MKLRPSVMCHSRLLRHLASEVRHRQYHDTDIVTVRVQAATAANGASS